MMTSDMAVINATVLYCKCQYSLGTKGSGHKANDDNWLVNLGYCKQILIAIVFVNYLF